MKEEREMTGEEQEPCPGCGAPEGYECAGSCGDEEDATVDNCNPTQAMVQEWKRVYEADGARPLINLASGSNNGRVTALWVAAMRATFGPVGLHESRRGADDTPDLSKCGDCFDRVTSAMADGHERIKSILGWADASEETFRSF